MKEAAQAMVAGETGQKSFRMNHQDWHVFFKPFIRNNVEGRTLDQLRWSVGVFYPDDDIFGSYNHLLYYVLIIAIVGLILFFVFCHFITRRQLKPLRRLTRSTKRIAQGHYEAELQAGESGNMNEIGQLQNHFLQMQQSLSAHMGELENLSTTLQERGKVLRKAYEQAKEADRMKTTFLHYMTNQMTIPSVTIEKSIAAICNNYHDISLQELDHNVEVIERESNVITDLLNRMLHTADNQSVRKGLTPQKAVPHADNEEERQ
jgi:methyl-accepting chemotaxis protein/sigma-B regulation protein RsbU (phosphoserine phosphatase)